MNIKNLGIDYYLFTYQVYPTVLNLPDYFSGNLILETPHNSFYHVSLFYDNNKKGYVVLNLQSGQKNYILNGVFYPEWYPKDFI